jgi:low temperature requirement protein LtrA
VDLRRREGGIDEVELRVSTLELFFDLVFVFTLTQLTSVLEHHVTFEAAARVLLVFVVLFWMYGGYAWLTNQVPPDRAVRRVLLIAGMAAFFVCALAVPGAFDESGVEFGMGYLLVVLVHAGLYAQTYGAAVLRFGPLNVVGALALVVAGLVDGPAAYALWGVPIALQIASSALTRRVDEDTRSGYDLRAAHFVERHGLLLIVAFGESVVAIGIGLGEQTLAPGTIAAAVVGLALAAALWWVYFGTDAERAEAALSAVPVHDRVRMALAGYFYAYIPTLLGVVVLAAGLALAVEDAGEPLETGPALMLGGGVGLYLAGEAAFRRALVLGPIAIRAAAAIASTATLALGVLVAASAQLIGLAVVLVTMLTVDARAVGTASRRADA